MKDTNANHKLDICRYAHNDPETAEKHKVERHKVYVIGRFWTWLYLRRKYSEARARCRAFTYSTFELGTAYNYFGREKVN